MTRAILCRVCASVGAGHKVNNVNVNYNHSTNDRPSPGTIYRSLNKYYCYFEPTLHVNGSECDGCEASATFPSARASSQTMQFEFKTVVPSSTRWTKPGKKICRPKTTFDVLLLHLVHRNSFNKIPEGRNGTEKPNAEPSRAQACERHSIRLNEEARAHTSSRNADYYYLRRHWCAVRADAFAIQLHFLVIVAGGNATPRPTINNRMFFCIVLQFLCSLRFAIAAFYRYSYALFISI